MTYSAQGAIVVASACCRIAKWLLPLNMSACTQQREVTLFCLTQRLTGSGASRRSPWGVLTKFGKQMCGLSSMSIVFGNRSQLIYSNPRWKETGNAK